jgi:hypothetical protein
MLTDLSHSTVEALPAMVPYGDGETQIIGENWSEDFPLVRLLLEEGLGVKRVGHSQMYDNYILVVDSADYEAIGRCLKSFHSKHSASGLKVIRSDSWLFVPETA